MKSVDDSTLSNRSPKRLHRLGLKGKAHYNVMYNIHYNIILVREGLAFSL